MKWRRNLDPIFLVFAIVLPVKGLAHGSKFSDEIRSLTINELDTITIPPCSYSEYYAITNFALKLAAQASDEEQALIGNVILSKTADHLVEEIQSNRLDIDDDSLQLLCDIYGKNNYLICQRKPSNYVKLAYHLCKGNYMYIYGRASASRYFIISCSILCAIVVFTFACATRVIKWRFASIYNRLIITFTIVMFILLIIFYSSCDTCITETKFFGISI